MYIHTILVRSSIDTCDKQFWYEPELHNSGSTRIEVVKYKVTGILNSSKFQDLRLSYQVTGYVPVSCLSVIIHFKHGHAHGTGILNRYSE